MKLQAMILLPMKTSKESCPLGNIVSLSQKLCHQSFVAPYSTGNRGNTCSYHVHEQSFTCVQYIFTTVKMTFNNCCIQCMVTMHWMQQLLKVILTCYNHHLTFSFRESWCGSCASAVIFPDIVFMCWSKMRSVINSAMGSDEQSTHSTIIYTIIV